MKLRKILSITMAIALLALAGCGNSSSGQSSTAAPSRPSESAPLPSVADVPSQPEKEEPKMNDEQLRALAFGAVLTTRNPMDYNTLEGGPDIFVQSTKQGLVDSWDVTDRESAIETLDWLRDEGHHYTPDPEYYSFDEVYQIIMGQVESDPEELAFFSAEVAACEAVTKALMEDFDYTEEELAAITTVSAWDYDRLVTITRWCYGNEYITEDEAWAYINTAAEKGSADYDDWRGYFAGVLYGRAIWSEDAKFSDQALAKELLQDSDSIYQKVSFR